MALKIDELGALPIYVDDSPVLTVLDMGAKLRRLKSASGGWTSSSWTTSSS